MILWLFVAFIITVSYKEVLVAKLIDVGLRNDKELRNCVLWLLVEGLLGNQGYITTAAQAFPKQFH